MAYKEIEVKDNNGNKLATPIIEVTESQGYKSIELRDNQGNLLAQPVITINGGGGSGGTSTPNTAVEFNTNTAKISVSDSVGTVTSSNEINADTLKNSIKTSTVQQMIDNKVNIPDFQTSQATQDTAITNLGAKDIELQTQIDQLLLSQKYDIVVSTKAELLAYDTTDVKVGSNALVLADEDYNNHSALYRFNGTIFEFVSQEVVDYYTKAEVDTSLNLKADKSNVYTKDEVDTSQTTQDTRITNLENRVDNDSWVGDKPNYYTKTQIDTSQSAQDAIISTKANTTDVYTKTQVDTSLNLKADKSTTYTKTEVDNISRIKGFSYSITKNQTIANNTTFNLLNLFHDAATQTIAAPTRVYNLGTFNPSLVDVDSSSAVNLALKFPAIDRQVNYTVNIRLFGTWGSSTATREATIRVAYGQGTASTTLPISQITKIQNSTDFRADGTIITRTFNVTDRFITDGILLNLENASGTTINLTGLVITFDGTI